MITIFLASLILLEIIRWIVIGDVILSWLQLAGIRFRPKFVASIMDPIYATVRKYIPTQIGMFDFTPIIIILLCALLSATIISISPETNQFIHQLESR